MLLSCTGWLGQLFKKSSPANIFAQPRAQSQCQLRLQTLEQRITPSSWMSIAETAPGAFVVDASGDIFATFKGDGTYENVSGSGECDRTVETNRHDHKVGLQRRSLRGLHGTRFVRVPGRWQPVQRNHVDTSEQAGSFFLVDRLIRGFVCVLQRLRYLRGRQRRQRPMDGVARGSLLKPCPDNPGFGLQRRPLRGLYRPRVLGVLGRMGTTDANERSHFVHD